jgi:3-methyladenine DNA glycosylase Mpg
MLIDVAALIGVFAAGYGLRAWMSTRRGKPSEKIVETEASMGRHDACRAARKAET